MKKIEFSNQDIQDIILMYENNCSLKLIGEKFNCDQGVIKRKLVELNKYNPDRRCKKYSLNDNYFEKIDSEEKAYWLGFIAADGSISKRDTAGSTLTFNLNVQDKLHLEKFLQAIESKAIIKEKEGSGFGEGTTIASVTINSTKMIEDLGKYNIVPKKSLILIPPNINPIFNKDYIRGYFDGDGTIYKSGTNFIIGFVGTKEILTWIKQELSVDNKLEKRKEDNKNNYYFRIGGTKKVLNILNKFYLEPKVYLERKFLLVNELTSRLQK